MKFISILLSALFLVSCQLNDKQRNRALDLTEQLGKPVSYYLIAKAVQAHVEDNPQCKALILEIADILKLGTISMVKAKVKVEAILLKANIPVLERKLISQALWDTVEFDDLELEGEVARYIATVGRYAELGALMASSSSK